MLLLAIKIERLYKCDEVCLNLLTESCVYLEISLLESTFLEMIDFPNAMENLSSLFFPTWFKSVLKSCGRPILIFLRLDRRHAILYFYLENQM